MRVFVLARVLPMENIFWKRQKKEKDTWVLQTQGEKYEETRRNIMNEKRVYFGEGMKNI